MEVEIPLYQLDAFTGRLFAGNPAAVCMLREWPEDALLQAVAAENNLSETAFCVRENDGWRLRWFTPLCEVDLCGHATLAAATVVFDERADLREIGFMTRSGLIAAWRDGSGVAIDLPASPPDGSPVDPRLREVLDEQPAEAIGAASPVYVYSDESIVKGLRPRLEKLRNYGGRLIVTAPGRDCDFVSRFFAPGVGIDEDPVTGSAHCILTPFWAARLGRARLQARQLSARGGELDCELRGDRVILRGEAVCYLRGRVRIPWPRVT